MIENNSQLPSHIKHYSEKVQSQWRHVFNGVYQKTRSVESASFAANSVLKKRFLRPGAMEKNNRHDYMLQIVDAWLGNLKG
jgi:hypothetical protein